MPVAASVQTTNAPSENAQSAQPLLFDEAYLLQVKTLAIRVLLTEGCGLDSCTRQESNTSGAKARRILDHLRPD
jgi:hypothetical protein